MNLPKLLLPWKHSYVKRSKNWTDNCSRRQTTFKSFSTLPIACTYPIYGWFKKAIYPSTISIKNYRLIVRSPWAVQQVGAIVNRPLRTPQKRWFHTRNGKGKAEKCCRDSVSFHQFNEEGPSQLVKMESTGSTGDQKKRGSRQPEAKLEIRGSLLLSKTRRQTDSRNALDCPRPANLFLGFFFFFFYLMGAVNDSPFLCIQCILSVCEYSSFYFSCVNTINRKGIMRRLCLIRPIYSFIFLCITIFLLR